MASVSVVGQHPGPGPHRLDSEPPQLLLLKLSGARKKIPLPRKASWEKMMFRRSPGSVSDGGGEARTHPQPPVPRPAGGETARREGGMPGEGCGAPRSPERDGEDRRISTTECNSYIDCDCNHNTGSRRRSSLRGSGTNVMPSGAVVNGHKRTHRDTVHWRTDSRHGDGGHQSISSSFSSSSTSSFSASVVVSARDRGRVPPLERLTQGRTGVVKLARAEPHRREAWTIFPRGMDPRVRTERGEGHRFQTRAVTQDWCDACSRQVTAQALKCQNCSYTCHLECEREVQLDCNKKDQAPEETPSPRSHCSNAAPKDQQNETKEEEEGGTNDLSDGEVHSRIEEYNAQVSENGMKLASDGSYTGFIKVHLRLSRPVTVPAVEGAGSDAAARETDGDDRATPEDQEVPDCEQTEKRTSFYLPCDCVKQLHISSLTTTREVIQGLLKKFMVLDNPCKFALYRQTHRDGQDLFQKLPLCERPLLLRLIAGPDAEKLTFVLKENETGEVEWHAFSVPELQNFLVILEKEEAERVRAVEQKYAVYRQKLQQALRQHDPSPVTL